MLNQLSVYSCMVDCPHSLKTSVQFSPLCFQQTAHKWEKFCVRAMFTERSTKMFLDFSATQWLSKKGKVIVLVELYDCGSRCIWHDKNWFGGKFYVTPPATCIDHIYLILLHLHLYWKLFSFKSKRKAIWTIELQSTSGAEWSIRRNKSTRTPSEISLHFYDLSSHYGHTLTGYHSKPKWITTQSSGCSPVVI